MSGKVKQFKPLKAVNEELDFSDVIFPVTVSIKHDGVYGLNLGGNFLGRSLKPMKNLWLTEKQSQEKFSGICGEICYANFVDNDLRLNRQDLCRSTTSQVNSINKADFPYIWVLFDYVGDGSEQYCYGVEYVDRMTDLVNKLDAMPNGNKITIHHICGIPYHEYMVDGITMIIPEGYVVNTPEELEAIYDEAIDNGYEGIVARSLHGVYKFGRATAKSQELVRFKPSGDSEIVITSFEPMFENNNEAKINELGHTERSSHKENKVQLDMVGALIGIDINTGVLTKVGAGKLTHQEREEIWLNQEDWLGRLSKYRFMATGIKTKPRHPRHIMFRALSDVELSEVVLTAVNELGITPK